MGNIIGVIEASQIPDLDAARLATGTLASDRIPTLAMSKVSGLTTALASKVETRTKINGHALEGDIKLETTGIIKEVTELPEEGVSTEARRAGCHPRRDVEPEL